MTTLRTQQRALYALMMALRPGAGGAVPTELAVVDLGDEVDRDSAVTAIRTVVTTGQLRATPVMLWHRGEEVLIGPHGVLVPTALVPDNPSLDVRVHVDPDGPARVVISWLDGPTREVVTRRLARQPDSGLVVDLLRGDFHTLVNDVIDAALSAAGDGRRLAAHPVLARVQAFRDGRETYYALLDVGATLLPTVKRRGRCGWSQLMRTLGELGDRHALDAVLDDLDNRIRGGEFFPVRAIDDHAMLTALFGVVALTARLLPTTTGGESDSGEPRDHSSPHRKVRKS